mgnify:CR=1 FL=1
MEFFDFIHATFSNEYDNVSNVDKKKHYFLYNRRMAIQFPQQANVLQLLKSNPVAVMDFWHHFLTVKQKYNKAPGWMYTKGVKKTLETKEKKTSISKNLIDEYARINKVDRKSVIDALEFYPEEMQKEIKEFEKIIKQ